MKKPAAPTEQTYAELQQAYEHFNRTLFDAGLPDCLITLQREKRSMGYFSSRRFADAHGNFTDEIAMNPSYFAVVPVLETMQTLVHEMCHLWQFHFGKPGRGRYHNEEWASKMQSIGLMPSSTGQPGGARTGERMSDYALQDGRFVQSCGQLLTTSFCLTWYDRFTDVGDRPRSPAHQMDSSVGGGEPPCVVNPALTQALVNSRNTVTTNGVGAGDTSENTAGTVKQTGPSNRWKYVCPCNTNVWGKPGLQIICGGCSGTFVAAQGMGATVA
ncbi:SprT family zinc-dependent metalloprotease [Diaphorobacter sp. HDW4A]|uniref:SprT-like domain-containing protein n=1 Tax=Diaphorobacter sp. HDW4A TaxID=2714924 RepID=UPI0014087046|nr:SprT-like domain-containing protein [Diaphorobacter sp. HDW4A]QIL80337.1 SprT family zinc-dependent metalloprotease [Diaphorobacter sp. HDW4A]